MNRDSAPLSWKTLVGGLVVTIVGTIVAEVVVAIIKGDFAPSNPLLVLGVLLLLVALTVSVLPISRRFFDFVGRLVQAAFRWTVSNWRLVVGLALLASVAFGAFVLTHQPWAAILTLGLALAIMLLAQYHPVLYRKRSSISLQAWNGKYLCAKRGGGRELVADRDIRSRWETFELIELGSNRIALRAWEGQYVRAEEGSGRLIADRSKVGKRETFELLELGNGRIALRAHNGRYVCAEGETTGNKVAANRDRVGEWETFILTEL